MLFFGAFNKTNNFAVMTFCAAVVPTNQHISTQTKDPIYFKFSAELNKFTPGF